MYFYFYFRHIQKCKLFENKFNKKKKPHTFKTTFTPFQLNLHTFSLHTYLCFDFQEKVIKQY